MIKNKAGRIIALVAMLCAMTALFAGCGTDKYDPLDGVETQKVNDDTGRSVEVPAEITKVAPSGSTATMMLITLAPDMMVGVSASPSTTQIKYFPDNIVKLPTFGQFYGGKASLNKESLIKAEPDVVIDFGDIKNTIKEDMNSIQSQTGIPALFYDGALESMPESYRKLGKLLGKEERAEEIAQFIEKTLAMVERNSAKISEDNVKTVYYGTGATGLACNANESSQAQVIDIIGANNAIIPDKITNKGGGTTVSLETLYKEEPDVIILTSGGPYAELTTNEWSGLKVVQSGSYYEIPGDPYCWMSSPPSINMVLGIWWLGQLVYPEAYNDYDIVEVAKECYKAFWGYDLSDEEARSMLSNSYFK